MAINNLTQTQLQQLRDLQASGNAADVLKFDYYQKEIYL